jgi:modulator of FtsH protease
VDPYGLAAWHDFYAALATATAALLGLLFVAITIRSSQVVANPALRKRAQISTQGMAGVMILALIALVPGIDDLFFAAAVLVVVVLDAIVYVLATGSVVRRRGGQTLGPWIRTVLNGLSGVFAVSGAISISVRAGGGLYLLVPSLLTILALWCFSAWRLVFPTELDLALQEVVAHKGSDQERPRLQPDAVSRPARHSANRRRGQR